MTTTRNKARASDTPITRFWEKIGLIAEISSVCCRKQAGQTSLEEILGLIQGVIPFDAATLYLTRSGSAELVPVAQLAAGVPLPPVFRSGNVGRLRRQPSLWHVDETDGHESDDQFVAILSVPLLYDGWFMGVLNLGSGQSDLLTEKVYQLLTIVANQVAVSIERMNRLAEVQSQNEALRHANQELVDGQREIIAAEKLAAAVELAAAVNHEINNPLAVIVGQIQCLLHEAAAMSEKSRGRLRRAEQAALQIAKVNRRLLQIERTIDGSTSMNSDPPPTGLHRELSVGQEK